MKLPKPLSSIRALLVACVLVGAVAAPSHAGSIDPPADGGWLDGYNRLVFRFNQAVDAGLEGWFAPEPGEAADGRVRGGVGNMAANLVNEPITAVASLAVGDLPTAWLATRRFAVNSTMGFLGWYDRAAEYGLAPVQSDIGLAMCRHGVGEGGYIMLPLIGPRTVRDAVADVAVVNAVLWTALGTILGAGAGLQTILIAETMEIAADIVATRQIDPHAIALRGMDFEATRREYLQQRRARCRIPVVAGPKPAL